MIRGEDGVQWVEIFIILRPSDTFFFACKRKIDDFRSFLSSSEQDTEGLDKIIGKEIL